MFQTRIMFSITAVVIAAGCLPSFAQVTDSTTVIEASGLKMTKAEFEALITGEPAYRKNLSMPAARKAIGDQYGKAFALEAEAKRRKMDEEPKIKLKIRAFTQQLLAAELLEEVREDYLKDEPKLKAVYEQRKQQYARPRVRQILVRTKGSPLAPPKGASELEIEEAQDKARGIRQKLASGTDFAKLAAEQSDDVGSKANGGDMGFIRRGMTAASFEDAAFRLPVGQLSEVIRTEYGFHIIKVEERQPESFDAVKKMLANDLAHRDLDAIILKGYKLNEAYFGK